MVWRSGLVSSFLHKFWGNKRGCCRVQGGERKEYVGACRVFGIGDKLIFEQLTRQDHEEMTMCAACGRAPACS